MEKLSIKSRSHDLCVFIGRFQPFHNGHLTVIKEALRRGDHALILIGSASSPRSYRNPFTAQERERMILDCFSNHDVGRLHVKPLEDSAYNTTAWVEDVQAAVIETLDDIGLPNGKVALIGHNKDNSSYYLKLFPQYDSIDVSQTHIIDATDIRVKYFESEDDALSLIDFEKQTTADLPCSVVEFLAKFMGSEPYNLVRGEFDYVKRYKKEWEVAPYPPIFVTVDACIVQSGHVLLVKRKLAPGKGLWALPGGFLNPDEYIEDAMIRELREETMLKVPARVLRGQIVEKRVFDEPHRSSRGRTITHAFLIHLPPDTALPKVQGADDAEKAQWMPLADLKREMFFEDHYSIISNLVAML
jgi:bifunctional NMN adenylyltransferase/nudix hydrolase